MSEEISLRKMIVHIIDSTIGMPILSDLEHTINGDIQDFIEKHITKLFKDMDLKKVYFTDDENEMRKNCKIIREYDNEFISSSKNIANIIHKIVLENPTIPSADLAMILFTRENCRYLGILKFNYKPSYIHFIEEDESGRVNRIIKQVTTLPSESQKVEECIFINLEDYSIFIKEKKYDIEGSKQYYLSNRILNTTEELTDKEKIDIINKATKKVVKEYYNDDVKKIAEIKNVIAESMEDTNTIDIEDVSNKVFSHNPDMKEIYMQEVEKGGLQEKAVTVNENIEKKVRRKQRLVTDEGIEIKLPVSFLTDTDKVEFVSNSDGTISILLKNITNIEDK